MIPTYFNPFLPFFERPASSIEQSAHRIVLPVLSKSAPSSVLYISTSMVSTFLLHKLFMYKLFDIIHAFIDAKFPLIRAHH